MIQDTYLTNRFWEEAHKDMLEFLRSTYIPNNESLDVRQALGRITGKTIRASRSSPHYPAAAMDGYAICAKETFGVNEREPKWFKLNQEAIQVDTGDPIPSGMNSVIMWEKVLQKSKQAILIDQPVIPWENVRAVGEDIIEGEVLLPINHLIRPQDQGALLAGGILEILVRRKPKVGILPTGDEIRSPEHYVEIGELVDSNSTMLSSLVREWGGEPQILPIIPDQLDLLEETIQSMAQTQDILVIIAGSSRGRGDYTSDIIRKYGTIFTHGVAIKPGKPVIIGEFQGKLVIGIPGYPVSAWVTAQLFLEAAVKHMLGMEKNTPHTIKATLSKKVFSNLGSEEFLRVKVGQVGKRWIAAPINRGAGVTMSLVRADGILRIPRLNEGFHDGQKVDIELLRPLEELKKTLICIGSHDLTLDLITSHMKAKGQGAVSSAHVGSMAGIMALRKGEAHFAGIHLLDPETGEYNKSYIRRFLPDKDVTLINLAYRSQGLLVPKGNPLGIKGLEDLMKENLRFVNRQAGSGTRVLLDYLLDIQGIPQNSIQGYEREEFTHLGVAVAISSGTADTGLGIQSAAESLGLDFISIGEERYDLAIPSEYLETSLMRNMLSTIRSDEFKKEVEELGGYDVRDTGKVV